MNHPRRAFCTLVTMLALAVCTAGPAGAQRDSDNKPSLSFKANPPVGFSPLRVRVSVDVRGGASDHVDFYCPTIEWDWGDDLTSEQSADCDPYQAGKSSITRRYTAEHTYHESGSYRIAFRLKQKSRVVATTGGNIQVRPGVREEFGN